MGKSNSSWHYNFCEWNVNFIIIHVCNFLIRKAKMSPNYFKKQPQGEQILITVFEVTFSFQNSGFKWVLGINFMSKFLEERSGAWKYSLLIMPKKGGSLYFKELKIKIFIFSTLFVIFQVCIKSLFQRTCFILSCTYYALIMYSSISMLRFMSYHVSFFFRLYPLWCLSTWISGLPVRR